MCPIFLWGGSLTCFKKIRKRVLLWGLESTWLETGMTVGYTEKISVSSDTFFSLNLPTGVRVNCFLTLSAVELERNTLPPVARDPIRAATLVVKPLAVYVHRDPV